VKIAMPYLQGRINEHFGISQEFIVFDVNEGKINDKKVISSRGREHNHGGLAELLIREGVNVIIAGGMGPPMEYALNSAGFKVITGASGEAEKAVSDFISGQLVTSSIGCNHGCGEHEHPGHWSK